MTGHRPRESELQTALLRRVLNDLERARHAAVVFDLDGTLLDNRPRTSAILARLATEWQVGAPGAAQALRSARPQQLVYRVEDCLRGLGVADSVLIQQAVTYWRARFFANSWLDRDVPLPGSVDFVRACYDLGAQVVYLTARDEPNMADGTFQCLRKCGFPAGEPRVALRMKPRASVSDDDFKRAESIRLGEFGRVLATFDNEPAHCNLFVERIPHATVVHVDTLHRPGAPRLASCVRTIKNFRMS